MTNKKWMTKLMAAMIAAAMISGTGAQAVLADEAATTQEAAATQSEYTNTEGSGSGQTENAGAENAAAENTTAENAGTESPAAGQEEAPAESLQKAAAPAEGNTEETIPAAPEAPEAPTSPEVEGLEAEEANELISAYNAEIDAYNEKVQAYNAEAEAYEKAKAAYNEEAAAYNAEAEIANAEAEEHNRAEDEKAAASQAQQEEYEQKLAKYTQTRDKYNGYAQTYVNKLGDIGRITKDNLEDMGTILTEDYYLDYGWNRTRQIGKPGDLLVSWDQLQATGGATISIVESADKSGETYKVANLHVYQDFATLDDLDAYYLENGYDCMNIEIDDNNGVFIIPSELLDHILVLEYDVAEADRNDTVKVTNQATVFQKAISVAAQRLFEDYQGYYWMSSNIFSYTAVDLEDDWAGNHTFSFRDGTTDGMHIKNPLNVNMYSSLYRYSNPEPEKPEIYTPVYKNTISPKALIEKTAGYLQALTHMDLFEIVKKTEETEKEQEKENEDPVVPAAPSVPAKPTTGTPTTPGGPSAPTNPTTPSTPISPIAPANPSTPASPIVPARPAAPVIPAAQTTVSTPAVTATTSAAPAAAAASAPISLNTLNAPAVIPEIPAAQTAEIKEEAVPQAAPQTKEQIKETENKTAPEAAALQIEEIEEEVIPQAAPAEEGAWALINLICTALSILAALAMAISFFRNKKAQQNEDGKEQKQTKKVAAKFLGIVPAAAAVVTFLLTEDMSRPMQMTDRWTILMLAILLVSLAIGFATRNKNQNEEIEEAAYQTA